MKKFICVVSSLFFMVGILIFPNATAWAAGLGMSVSSQSVNVGDTVTATVSVPSGYGATVALSYDSSVLEVISSSGNGALLNLGDAMGQPASGTVTFKAVGAGSCTISATSTVAGDANGDPVSLDGASAGVTVANAITEPPADNPPAEGNEGTQEPVLSADNSLASLVLSDGELSPAFSYDTTKYTAVVDYDVTNIAISAKTSNSKAQIISLSGNENLAVGENTIKIVVKAENGVTATYVITVTRRSQEESGNTVPDDVTQPDNQYTDQFVINGVTLTPAEIIPDDVIPGDFTSSTIALAGVEYPCLQYNNGAVTLLYFVEEGAESGALYVYEQSTQSVYPYIRLNSESGYILILVPAQELVDEDWQEISLVFEGKGIADVFHSTQQPEDFYYVYAMNQNGVLGWYQYDSVEGTYLRYIPAEESEVTSDSQVEAEEYEHLKESYARLNEELAETNQKSRLYIGIFAAIAAVLFIGIIILFVLSKNGRGETFDEEDDEIDETASDGESDFYENLDSVADTRVEDFSEELDLEETKPDETEPEETEPEEDGHVKTAGDELTEIVPEEAEAQPVQDVAEEPEQETADAVSEHMAESESASEAEQTTASDGEDDDLEFIDL